MNLKTPHVFLYERTIRESLDEDLSRAGDLTTDSIIPNGMRASGKVVACSKGCVAGIEISLMSFRILDPQASIEILVPDGSLAGPEQVLATVEGSARALLMAERTALNLLGHLSGIASATHAVVERVKASRARIVCTRKTIPGLRALEKYAVRAGGGFNHRFGLDDGVLIKENHLAIAGGIHEAVKRVRNAVGHMVKVEVEVETLEQLEEALKQEVDAVMLDNMTLEQIREAVQIVEGRVVIEVSGGITPETVGEIAATGVDILSMGWLTHSAPALDVSLDLTPS